MKNPEENKTCPYCLSDIQPTEATVRCPKCGVMHHAECWQANGSCSVYGCDGWAVWNEQITNKIAPDADMPVKVSQSEATVTKPAEPVYCIKCGIKIKQGRLICRKCKKNQPRHYFENCFGPSVIMLSIFIGVVTIIIKALV